MSVAVSAVANELSITSANDVMMAILSFLVTMMVAFSIVALLAIAGKGLPKAEYFSNGLIASLLSSISTAIFVAFAIAAPSLGIIAVAGLLSLAGIMLTYVKLIIALAVGENSGNEGSEPLVVLIKRRDQLYKQMVWALLLFFVLEIAFVSGYFVFASTMWGG